MPENARPSKTGKYKNQGRNRKTPVNAKDNAASTNQNLIFGFHAALAALNNPERKIEKVMATKNAANRILEALGGTKMAIETVTADRINAMLPRDSVHQGVLVVAKPLPDNAISDIIPHGPVIVLDQVTDPHNVGAIMRTACAFGAAGLVVTSRNAPYLTGILAKAASGAVEHLPIIRVVNLARAIDELNDAGYQTIGLSDSADKPLLEVMDTDANPRPVALVLGAEGRGIRALTAKTCTDLARIDLPGPINILNVSNATAVALTIICKFGQPEPQ